MSSPKPRVSIGLPVFNGEKFLQKALDSLLALHYSDFELIISDNASTDRTAEICQAYAAMDPRVQYYRNSINIGAMQNWYRSFQLSSGEYFLGAAHDDAYHPDFLGSCVGVLEKYPEVVVCYTRTKVIDDSGNFVRDFHMEIDTMSSKPHVRLYNAIGVDYLCIQLLGVFRASAFKRVREYAGYSGCDWNTLAELSLLGKIYEVPEYLFYHRLYLGALGVALHSGRSLQELFTLDPGINWRLGFPALIKVRNYFSAVSRAPISPTERLLCYLQLVRLMAEKAWNRLGKLMKVRSESIK